MDDGRWTMDDGRWTMDDGRWGVAASPCLNNRTDAVGWKGRFVVGTLVRRWAYRTPNQRTEVRTTNHSLFQLRQSCEHGCGQVRRCSCMGRPVGRPDGTTA